MEFKVTTVQFKNSQASDYNHVFVKMNKRGRKMESAHQIG